MIHDDQLRAWETKFDLRHTGGCDFDCECACAACSGPRKTEEQVVMARLIDEVRALQQSRDWTREQLIKQVNANNENLRIYEKRIAAKDSMIESLQQRIRQLNDMPADIADNTATEIIAEPLD